MKWPAGPVCEAEAGIVEQKGKRHYSSAFGLWVLPSHIVILAILVFLILSQDTHGLEKIR